MDKKYNNLITCGIEQPLELLKFHKASPFKRRLMSDNFLNKSSRMHIAVHEIRNRVPKMIRQYSVPHAHNCREWNLILSFDQLIYEIVLGNETYTLKSPALIFIPPYLVHSANVIEGRGFFIAIVDSDDYANSIVSDNTGDVNVGLGCNID